MNGKEPLVSVNNLKKHYYENQGFTDRMFGLEPTAIKAVDGISFDVQNGETYGLVGESGCGKSTTGETILDLREPTDGEVRFKRDNIYEMDKKELKEFRRKSQIVFQDPFSSLNPRLTISEIVKEPLVVHDIGTKEERHQRTHSLLERVGLISDMGERYPHEFSGGQRQRIAIARALSIDPELLVLDEPTSALDVSVQAQILNLLEELQNEFGLTYIIIAHNLGVIRHICDRVGIMYLGELVETGPTEQIFQNPSHPYTEALLKSVPRPDSDEKTRKVDPLPGDVPSPRNPPSGCRFHTRCPYARESCREETPKLIEIQDEKRHETACFRALEAHPYWNSDELSRDEEGMVK